jgi:serine/threonine protein kinase/WD40 repeat protein
MADETKPAGLNAGDITTLAGPDAGDITTLAGHEKTGAPSSSGNAVIPGSRLLDLYDVDPGKPAEGGFGKVFKVRHSAWNTDLALKQPKPGMFETEKQKDDFVRECETWINLGLHPHIVSCYYVREIGGVPSIFSEWMEGGSLKDWIKSGKLYAGGEEELQKRILDISIQFARGLNYAQEKGFIHRDVKPGNLLMTADGTAKVADFGLANAKAAASGGEPEVDGGTDVSYTPDYASPEQAGGGEISAGTDVWSWAVSVLEMYCGERRWSNERFAGGPVAGKQCEYYFPLAKYPIPEMVKEVLRGCFKGDAQERTDSFAEIEMYLLAVYEEAFGEAYPREYRKAASDTAGSLNNKALSFIDLGKPGEAESCWEEALSRDKTNADAFYNQTVHLWHTAKIDLDKAVSQIELMLKAAMDHPHAAWLAAQFYLECRDYERAADLLKDLRDERYEGEAQSLYKSVSGIPAAISKGLGNSVSLVRTGYQGRIALSPDGKTLTVGSPLGVETYEIKGGGDEPSWRQQFIRRISQHNWDTPLAAEFFELGPGGALAFAVEEETKNLRIYSTQTGKLIRAIPAPANEEFLYLDSNNRELVTFSAIKAKPENYSIRVWNLANGECLSRSETSFQGKIFALRFRNDHKFLAAGRNGSLLLIETATGKITSEFVFEYREVCDIRFHPLGRLILLTCERGLVLVNLNSGKTLNINRKSSGMALFSAREDRVFSVGRDISLWDLRSGREIYRYKDAVDRADAFKLNLADAQISPSGQLFAIRSFAGTIFTLPALEKKASFSLSRIISVKDVDQGASVESSIKALLAEKEIAAALRELNKARLIPQFADSPSRLELNNRIGRFCRIKSVRSLFARVNFFRADAKSNAKTTTPLISRDGRFLFAQNRLFDFMTANLVREFAHNTKFPYFSPDGEFLILGGRLYPTDGGDVVEFADGYIGTCFTPDGNFLCIGAPEKDLSRSAEILKSKTGRRVRSINPQLEEFFSWKKNKEDILMQVSTDGKYLLMGQCIWETDTGRLVWQGKEANDRFFGFENFLVTRTYKTVVCQDILTGEKQYQINLFQNPVGFETGSRENRQKPGKFPETVPKTEVLEQPQIEIPFTGRDNENPRDAGAFGLSQNGKYGITQTYKGTSNFAPKFALRLFDMTNGKEIRELKGANSESLTSVIFSPDDRYALTGGETGKAQYWKIDTGKCKASFPFPVSSAVFHPSGSYAAAINKEGCHLLVFDYEYEFPGWTDWDEAALPYLENFITLYKDGWTEKDFNMLILELQNRGLGYIRPEGVRKKLECM